MSIVLNTGFSIGSKDLVYDKFVLTKEEMLNIHENTYPDQFFALCSDDDKMYSFNINNTPNAETGKFKVMSGGSTAIDDDDVSSTTVYSSEKIDTDFQKITDDNLTTTDKTTTGAINELAIRIDEIKITDIIDDTNTEATDKTLSSSKIESEIQAIIDDTKATENNVLSAKYMLNNFEPRKEVVSKSKLTYSTNYIRAFCDYAATIPATVRVTDDDGSMLLVTGSANGSWRAVRLIKGETDRFHKVYYNNGYVYIQVDNDSTYTIFGGSFAKVFGSAEGTEILIENSDDTDIDIPTDCTADAVSYVNNTIGSANVEEALNKLIADFYYVAPSVTSFTASPSGGVFEIGTTISAPITFNWNYNKDITTQTLTDCTLADETVRTATYNTDITTNKTFTLSANDGKNNVSKSISYTFVNPFYVGVSATDTVTETDIIALTKKVEAKGNKTINYTTSQSHMVFAYNSSYGSITKIIDKNGFDVTGSFVKSTVSVNSVDYYVYVSNKCPGSYQMKFNY